jgi:HK97 family phage prohead protease
MSRHLERRDLSFPVMVAEDEKRLTGYIARFNTESNPLFDRVVYKDGPFVEVIKPGAFSRTLRESQDIPALFNHQMSQVLGRTSSRTLKLVEDEVGLFFDVELPDTSLGHDTREMVRRGDIRGCSWGMYVVKDEILVRQGAPLLRSVYDLDLFEVSPACTVPAYDSSSVELRDMLDQYREQHRERSTAFPLLKLAALLLTIED